jgi:glutaconate CoA-transferase subunit A
MYSMVQAGSMGVPFVPTLGYAGTDILERREDFKVIPHPFAEGERIVVAEAITPDVALFHGPRADRFGNVLAANTGEALTLALASRKVIVSVEEIVDEVSPHDHAGEYIPALNVTAVVHAPFGAHPTGCPGFYEEDVAHVQEYVEASVSDDAFSGYLERYVFGPGSHDAYLDRVGLKTEEKVPGPVG